MFILFIAPDDTIAATAEKIFKDNLKNVYIETGNLEDAVPVAKKYESKADVIITRGGTVAHLLDAGIKTPIIELLVTGQDIADSIRRALDITEGRNKKVAVITFRNMVHSFEAFSDLLKIDIQKYYLSKGEVPDQRIMEAVSKGAEVIIGGVITAGAARKLGFKAVEIRSGVDSILQSLREAENIVNTRNREQKRNRTTAAILETSHDGVLSIDSENNILIINNSARYLLDLKNISLQDVPVRSVSKQLGLDSSLRGVETSGKLCRINNRDLLINTVPLKISNKIIGAVSSFQDVTIIQKIEGKIRKKLTEKGLNAKIRFSDIIGDSEILNNTVCEAESYAEVDSSVLIYGESGVGKEMFAQSIHNASGRSKEPFVAVNCAALPENLIESELFGYAPGAFTGASREGKTGLFELAHKGTIFLDEISELPVQIQGRLLRVIQEREIMKIGDDRVIPIDVRIIASSNKHFADIIEKGEFREDLFWRLNVLHISIPPLRDRKDDIPALFNHFLSEFLGSDCKNLAFSDISLDILKDYEWRGNIRELKNFSERVSVRCRNSSVTDFDIKHLLDPDNDLILNTNNEKTDIKKALSQAGGNKTIAARFLGMHRSTLWRKIKEYKII